MAAFRRLAEEFHAGRILVTTTRRLLGYRRALCEIEYSCRCGEDGLKIDVRSRMGEVSGHRLSPADLASLTFYVPDSQSVRVEIDGAQVPNLRRNPPDHTGRPSVSVPWPQLDLPTL